MKPVVSLLGLIHQHLLQAGFSKAARDLQTQSDEKFFSPGTSLQDIYTDWVNRPENTKKRKNTKANDVPSKKLRVSDPKSSSETSEDEETATASQRNLKIRPQFARKKEKKRAVKQASKVKTLPSTLKGMNSANQPETKQEVQSKVEPTVQKNAATLTAPIKESSDSSDSEKESITEKSAPPTLKPVPEDSDSDETSSSDESEMEVDQNSNDVRCIPDIAAGKKSQIKGPSNGIMAHQTKDAVKTEAGDTSDSDSTDIETPNAAAAQRTTPSLSSKGTKQPVTVKIPLSVLKDVPEENDSDSNKEKEDQVVVTPQVPPLMPKAKTSTSSKTTKQPMTQSTAKSALPTPQQVDSSSGTSDSESEEEPVSKKVVATPQAPKAKAITSAKPAKQPVTPLPMQQAADDSSGDSDSEEEQEAQKVVATPQTPKAKAITSAKPAKQPVTPAPAKAPLPMQQVADDSSEDSDSEEEQEQAQTVLTPAQASKSIAMISSKAVKLLTRTPAKDPLPIQQPTNDSSDDSDSKSEEEAEAQTAVTAPKATKAKPTISTKSTKQPLTQMAAITPLPAHLPVSDSSEESDSESEEEAEAKVVTVQQATKGKTSICSKTAKQQTTPAPLKPPLPASAHNKDSNLGHKRQEAKKVQTPAQAKKGKNSTSSKAAMKSVAPTPAKSPVLQHTDDSSDSEEEPDTKIVALPDLKKGKTSKPKAAKQALTPTPIKSPVPAQQPADDSSDVSSTDSEEELDAKKVVATPQATKGKSSISSIVAKQPVNPSSIKTPVSVQQPADDSSDESSTESEQEQPDVKQKVVTPPQETKGKRNTPRVSKLSITPILAKTTKATKRPATKITTKVPVQQPAADNSDSNTDREEPPAKTADAATKLTVPTSKPAIQPLKAAKGKIGSPVKAVAILTPAVAVSSSSDSDSSDSEEEETRPQLVPPTPVGSKSTLGKLASPPLLSSTPFDTKPAHGKGGSPAKAPVVVKPSIAETSSSSEDSDNPEPHTLFCTPPPVTIEKNKQKVTRKSATKSATTTTGTAKGKVTSPLKVAALLQEVTSESSDTSDSEEEPSLKPENPSAAGKLLSSQNSSAQTKPSQPSALAVTSSSSDSSDSELESSQALPKTPLPPVLSPQKPKPDRKTKTKQTAGPAKEKKKNASKSKSKPLAAPVQLSMLESEEETVQALLEGRSPKKNKVKKSASKKVMGPNLTADRTLHEQNNSKNGIAAEHLQTLPPAIATAPIPQSEKKSSKKRKLLEDDGVSVKKAKLDKKAKKDKKKEKKSKLDKGEAGSLTPKNKLSKKDKNKSNKSKKKKKDKDKKKKEGKKTTPALTPHVEGIPVSATNAVSKPKKKKKSKSEKFLL
uniref:Treacle protein n=1 Tax=Leptobrachium leishanense TaxID=445787 RepID=A0A8C5WH78_9ANUR